MVALWWDVPMVTLWWDVPGMRLQGIGRDESSEVCRWFQGETRTLILEPILLSLPGRPKKGLQGLSGGRGSSPRWQHHSQSKGWFINVCTNTLL